MATFEQTKAGYAKLWKTAVVTQPAKAAVAAKRIVADRAVFAEVEKATGVPWYMVGCMLWRESDLDLHTYLGNGQNLYHVTTIVPVGRGPFTSFQEGAVDALTVQGMIGITDWTIERILYWLEKFNGQGYFHYTNSPYLWSWTNLYTSGKFTSDHHFDPEAVDQQGGCAAILKTLEAQGVVTFTGVTKPEEPPVTTTPPVVAPQHLPSFADMEKFVESADKILPIVGMFFPPALLIHTEIIPILEEILTIASQVQAGKPMDFNRVSGVLQRAMAAFQNIQKAMAHGGMQPVLVGAQMDPGGGGKVGGP